MKFEKILCDSKSYNGIISKSKYSLKQKLCTYTVLK